MQRIGRLAVLLVFLEGSATGELVYFANGGQAQLPAKIDGDAVILSAPNGPVTFHRDDFRKIVPGFCPEREWPIRRDTALERGAPARFAAAWWALENGLTPEAEAMLRWAQDADRSYVPAVRLIAWLDRLSTPGREPDLAPLLAISPGHWRLTRGEHVILLHRHAESDAVERIGVLERALKTFYLSFAAQGIELSPPPTKLVSVWFAEKSDYLAYLKRDGAGAFLTTRGYYHPTQGFVLAYDSRSDPSRRRALDSIAACRREGRGIEKALATLPEGGRISLSLAGKPARLVDREQGLAIADDERRDLNRRALLVELERRDLDLGTAAHELIHQLVAQSGLAPRHADLPFWLHEGLAMQFEVVRGGRWAGIGRINDQRLADWRKSDAPPRLAPLIRDRGFGRGYRADLYSQAWALVYFLRKEHPDEFVAWLSLLRESGRDEVSPSDRAARMFESILGPDLSTRESAWRGFIGTLQTRFEEGDCVAGNALPSYRSD